MTEPDQIQQLVWTVAYVALGIVLFGAAFWVLARIVPFSIRKEIEEDQNTALGIIIGAIIIGVAIIIAAGIH